MSDAGVAASVRQRLLDEARARGRPFQEIWQYFAIERFLYRLSRHPCADRFILKGALLMTVWGAPAARPTFDIDLAGRTAYNVHNFSRLIRSLCRMRSTEDGITFHADFVDVAKLGIDGQYEGVRGRFRAALAGDPVPMQVDLTYDNLIVPGPLTVTYPVILDFPAPVLLAYPREAVVAEKLSALVTRGLLTGRLKDYYDLWLLSRLHPFDGARLAAAIRAIFEHRGTEIQANPTGLAEHFSADGARATQWRALRLRSGFDGAPETLLEAVRSLGEFLHPPLAALDQGRTFALNWQPGGPWL
jgi:hypothetical protein